MSRMLGAELSHNRAYLAVVWTDAPSIESVYVDGKPVDELPYDVPLGSDVFVRTETLIIGIRVLGRTALGVNAPIRLVERDGMISLEIHNYEGPEKTFWELANPGAFFKGLPFCAFYSEIVERDEWDSDEHFMKEFSSGISAVDLDDIPGLGDTNQRQLTANYSRSGQTIGIEVDLVSGELIKRFTEQGIMDLPKMDSTVAQHSAVSPIEIGDSRLEFGSGDAWLLSMPDSELWVAGIQGDAPSDIALTTEHGQQTFQGMTSGLIVRRGDDIKVVASPPSTSPTPS